MTGYFLTVGESDPLTHKGEERSRTTGKIHIELLGVFRDIIGTNEIEIEDPGEATLGDLISILSERFGETARNRLLDASGDLDETLGVIVNGKVLNPDVALGTRVKAGDRLVLTQAMSGG